MQNFSAFFGTTPGTNGRLGPSEGRFCASRGFLGRDFSRSSRLHAGGKRVDKKKNPARCGSCRIHRGLLPSLAEREGFEPPVQLPVHRISSAARSTTPASLPNVPGNFRFGTANIGIFFVFRYFRAKKFHPTPKKGAKRGRSGVFDAGIVIFVRDPGAVTGARERLCHEAKPPRY